MLRAGLNASPREKKIADPRTSQAEHEHVRANVSFQHNLDWDHECRAEVMGLSKRRQVRGSLNATNGELRCVQQVSVPPRVGEKYLFTRNLMKTGTCDVNHVTGGVFDNAAH